MAAVDFFLDIDGVAGESKDAIHTDEIDVITWSWGETQEGSQAMGGGGGTGKVKMKDFVFAMNMNAASPVLMKACASGKHFRQAVLTARKAGGGQLEFFKVTMSDVIISSYSTGGSAGGPIPLDHITLNFAKIEFEYKKQDARGGLGGAIKGGYDVKLNKPF